MRREEGSREDDMILRFLVLVHTCDGDCSMPSMGLVGLSWTCLTSFGEWNIEGDGVGKEGGKVPLG